MSVKEIVTYDQKKFIQSTSPYLITFNLYLLQNCEEKRQQVHSTYAMLFQQINKHKYNKHTKTANIQTQKIYTSNKQTKTTNIQTQQTNIQIQQQQKLKDNKYTNPTSIQIQKKLIQQTHKSNKHTKTTNTALWES